MICLGGGTSIGGMIAMSLSTSDENSIDKDQTYITPNSTLASIGIFQINAATTIRAGMSTSSQAM